MRISALFAHRSPVSVFVLLTCFTALFEGQANPRHPQPKVVALDSSAKDYLSVLRGPPESAGMKSGYVVLSPRKSAGKHSTEHHEEVLVVLEDAGEMLFKGRFEAPSQGKFSGLLSAGNRA
jgi:hypothetical protein